MKICPECLLEFVPEKNTCPDCDIPLVERDAFTMTMDWPHCESCGSATARSDIKCADCGQKFYTIPFAPKIMAIVAGAVAFYAAASLMNMAGLSEGFMKLAAMAAGLLTWMVLNRRINQTPKEAPIPWSVMDSKTREGLRQAVKDTQSS